MNFKEFFKLSWGKVILTIVLLIITTFLFFLIWNTYDATYWGFPIAYYVINCGFKETENCEKFILINLIIDVIIWYLISCLIINLIKKRT